MVIYIMCSLEKGKQDSVAVLSINFNKDLIPKKKDRLIIRERQ